MSITRRQLLKLGVGAGLAPAFRTIQALVPSDGFTFCYFSDTHIALQRNLDECREMLLEMREQIAPDFAINGGDVTDYGLAREYANWRVLLAELPCPVHHVPGNHDVRWSPLGMKVYRESVGPAFSSFDHKGCHFVVLDSTVPLSHWGHYESAQLRWLEEDLKRVGREMPVFVTTHHWVGRDRMMIDNEEALRRILEPYNVKLILNGHGHNDLLWHWDGHSATMNKGLYQGSYQKIEVDRLRGEVRLSRRTTERPAQRLLTRIPLAASRGTRPVWSLGPASVAAGEPIPASIEGVREFRWNGGAWSPVEGAVTAVGLAEGRHALGLREGPNGLMQTVEVWVRKDSSPLEPRWERPLTGGVMSHLKIGGDLVVVSAMDGSVSALRKADGEPVWRFETGDYCHSSPWIEGDRVLVGSADGHLYCLGLRDGRLRWKHTTEGPIYASPACARGIAAIASGDGKVYGARLVNGVLAWTYALPTGDTAFSQSPAASDGTRIFVGAWDRHLYAIDAAAGTLAWRRQCTDRSFAFSPAIGAPATEGGRVYVPSNDNGLHAFDAASGEPLWKATTPGQKFGYSGPRIAGDRIVIGCLGDDAGEFRCVSREDGRELWCVDTGSTIYDSTPAVAEGHASIGSVDGTLSVVRIADGQIVAQHRLPTGHFLASPAAEPGSIYAASYSDRVVAFTTRLEG
jgi:outer membrane protein assembly factor BamB